MLVKRNLTINITATWTTKRVAEVAGVEPSALVIGASKRRVGTLHTIPRCVYIDMFCGICMQAAQVIRIRSNDESRKSSKGRRGS